VIRTIAVGFDDSPGSQRALRWAMDLAVETGAWVTVLHAVGLLEHGADPAGALRLEESMSDVVRQHRIDGSRVRWCVLDGDPCSVLLQAGEAPLGADLVVVGSRGRSLRTGLLLGSTSLELAEHSRIPVLIVPEEERSPPLPEQ
jgi:nucleotide-binding universal stress UspA family protein